MEFQGHLHFPIDSFNRVSGGKPPAYRMILLYSGRAEYKAIRRRMSCLRRDGAVNQQGFMLGFGYTAR